MKSIVNGKIYKNQTFIEDDVLIFGESIKQLMTREEYIRLKDSGTTVFEEIDAQGHYVVPGFIDVHIHGYKGVDVMDGDVDSIEKMAKGITENGVTAFLATTMTMDKSSIMNALNSIRKVMTDNTLNQEGAMVLGAHLEGPFINTEYKGAQSERYVIPPAKEWLDEFGDTIKVVTIAPEIEGALEIIESYSDTINFSLGHTGASYEKAMEAYAKGAKSATHLFNAMTGLHHRNPGVVGAAFSCDCYSELIADNIHVHPDLYPLVMRVKGKDRLLLITDCMRAGGLPEGEYDLGGQAVTVKDHKCTLKSGTIAGSVLKLNEGLNHFNEVVEEELAQCIGLVTENQAQYLKVDHIMGTLDVNKLANIVIMDEEINIIKTFVKGSMVYEN